MFVVGDAALSSEEHVALPDQFALGDQIRIVGAAGKFALFTVKLGSGEIVGLSDGGRRRIAVEVGDGIEMSAVVARSELSDDEARDAGELVEREIVSANNIIALAPHGGMIEEKTDIQVLRIVERLGSAAWYCRGWKPGGGAFDRWHITSTDISERSFPLLAKHIGKYETAVAFHGHGKDEILVGGAADESAKIDICAAISRAVGDAFVVRIAGGGDAVTGLSAKNVVNRVTRTGRGGIQIEQPIEARRRFSLEIADAVADGIARAK